MIYFNLGFILIASVISFDNTIIVRRSELANIAKK